MATHLKFTSGQLAVFKNYTHRYRYKHIDTDTHTKLRNKKTLLTININTALALPHFLFHILPQQEVLLCKYISPTELVLFPH